MKSCSVIFAAAASLVLLGGSVAAADVASITEAPEVTIASDAATTGWYIRGDIGYAAWIGDEGASYRIDNANRNTVSAGAFDSSRFAKPFSFGGGIGYQFTDIWRADLTGDFSTSDFSGMARSGQPCAAAPAGTSCSYDTRGDMRANGILANGYVDLATVKGFTPYLGAGLGVTNVRWSNMRSQPGCVNGASACSGTAPAQQDLDGASSWRFTYALMAGVSYEIADHIKLDLGYRFSDIAGGDMFSSAGLSGHDDGLMRHEFRIGIRIAAW
jgi:opacity protein-like surface antigen